MSPRAETLAVRDVVREDVPALTSIYRHHVLHGLGTFEEEPPDAEEMARRWNAIRAIDLPYLAAEADGQVLGFAYAAPFRMRSAYRFTVEDSVYVAPDAVGRGVGKALLNRVVDRCEALGVRQVTAVIGDSGNAASIGLHETLGFRRTGAAFSVGYKHGRWVDIVFMQKALGGGGETPPTSQGLRLQALA